MYTQAATPKLDVESVNGPPSPSEISTGMDEGPPVPFEQHWDSAGEEELSEVEADIIFQAQKLAVECDAETDDCNKIVVRIRRSHFRCEVATPIYS